MTEMNWINYWVTGTSGMTTKDDLDDEDDWYE